jgi:hypothetical protein
LALAYRAAALEQPNFYDLYLGGIRQDLAPTEEDLALAYRSFERVLVSIRRCVATGRFPGRDPMSIGVQAWALVHGLASLELRGFLGPEDTNEARWRDAVGAALVGYQQPPDQALVQRRGA